MNGLLAALSTLANPSQFEAEGLERPQENFENLLAAVVMGERTPQMERSATLSTAAHSKTAWEGSHSGKKFSGSANSDASLFRQIKGTTPTSSTMNVKRQDGFIGGRSIQFVGDSPAGQETVEQPTKAVKGVVKHRAATPMGQSPPPLVGKRLVALEGRPIARPHVGADTGTVADSKGAGTDRGSSTTQPSPPTEVKTSTPIILSNNIVGHKPSEAMLMDPVLAMSADVTPSHEVTVKGTHSGADQPQLMPEFAARQPAVTVRGAADGVVKVMIDADLTVAVKSSDEGVEVLLEGSTKAVEPVKNIGPELRASLERNGFTLSSFDTQERQAAPDQSTERNDPSTHANQASSSVTGKTIRRGEIVQVSA